VPATNTYRLPEGRSPDEFAEAIEERILFEGPDTVAAVIIEPVQNGGGCIPAPPGYFERVREICDEYDVLMISDEVICSWSRLGEWFGCQRYDYVPDLITTAKGLAGAYAAMGAVIIADRVAEPFADGPPFMHGFTFGGHPMSCAIALANIDVIEGEGVNDNVRANEPALRGMLEGLRDIPIVGDVRGHAGRQRFGLRGELEDGHVVPHQEAEHDEYRRLHEQFESKTRQRTETFNEHHDPQALPATHRDGNREVGRPEKNDAR
jgi:adenosylmethionine-8-amino-7-oxononanoate aminotransferase